MSSDKRARLRQWLESGEASLHPLTFPQRELWEASAISPTDPANHICCLIHVRGLITPEDCRAAIERVVARQEALRLTILPGKAGPVQMVRKGGEASFRFRDLSAAQGQRGDRGTRARDFPRALRSGAGTALSRGDAPARTR